MEKLNLRLTVSLLAACTVVALALLPVTRPFFERQVWILSGTYERRTGQDPADLLPDAYAEDKDRIRVLLSSQSRLPSLSRAFELSRIAEGKKDPAIWAHVIRQTSMAPVPSSAQKSLAGTDQIRYQSVGSLELRAAREGTKLQPQNAFFPLSEATALAKLGRWEEIVGPLEQAARADTYDDHVFDDFERRISYLKDHLKIVLASDLARDFATILFPHFSNYKSLYRGLALIKDPAQRLRAGIAIAKIGRILEGSDEFYIKRVVGTGLVVGSLSTLAGVKEVDGQFSEVLQLVAAQAKRLGLSSAEADLRAFQAWKRPVPKEFSSGTIPTDYFPILGAQSLFVAIVISGMGAAIWLVSHIDPNWSNAWSLFLSIVGGLVVGGVFLDHGGPIMLGTVGSSLISLGFLSLRLPGKQKTGYRIAVAGLTLLAISCVILGNLSFLWLALTLWAIPFALANLQRVHLKKWAGIGLSVVFFGIGLALLGETVSRDPVSFGKYLPQTVIAVSVTGLVLIPWLTALVMSVTKLNLPESLKVLLTPFPCFALVAVGFLTYSIRNDIREEKIWRKISTEDLSPRYRELLERSET